MRLSTPGPYIAISIISLIIACYNITYSVFVDFIFWAFVLSVPTGILGTLTTIMSIRAYATERVIEHMRQTNKLLDCMLDNLDKTTGMFKNDR